MRVLLLLAIASSCGVDTGGRHKVEVSDSTQEVVVTTELSTVLEICDIKRDEAIVKYKYWSKTQLECWNLLASTLQIGLPND
jgi:hypothetical protein